MRLYVFLRGGLGDQIASSQALGSNLFSIRELDSLHSRFAAWKKNLTLLMICTSAWSWCTDFTGCHSRQYQRRLSYIHLGSCSKICFGQMLRLLCRLRTIDVIEISNRDSVRLNLSRRLCPFSLSASYPAGRPPAPDCCAPAPGAPVRRSTVRHGPGREMLMKTLYWVYLSSDNLECDSGMERPAKNTFKVSSNTCSILDRLNNREETAINYKNT